MSSTVHAPPYAEWSCTWLVHMFTVIFLTYVISAAVTVFNETANADVSTVFSDVALLLN